MIEIAAEETLVDPLLEIMVGRTDEAKTRREIMLSSHRTHSPRLQDTKQSGLSRER